MAAQGWISSPSPEHPSERYRLAWSLSAGEMIMQGIIAVNNNNIIAVLI